MRRDYSACSPKTYKSGGSVKGGKMKKFEGSAKDMAQDKKLAKKRGMSLKKYEASAADKKHDAQQSMKGLKSGGGIKIRGTGAATKGTMARGPMG